MASKPYASCPRDRGRLSSGGWAWGYALPTLRRRVAAIARAHRIAGFPLDTKHPAVRETLRGIGRTHGEPARRSAALTTTDMRRLVDICGDDLTGLRDRQALLLICFAG